MILRNAWLSFFQIELHNTENKSKTEFEDGAEERYPMNLKKQLEVKKRQQQIKFKTIQELVIWIKLKL